MITLLLCNSFPYIKAIGQNFNFWPVVQRSRYLPKWQQQKNHDFVQYLFIRTRYFFLFSYILLHNRHLMTHFLLVIRL